MTPPATSDANAVVAAALPYLEKLADMRAGRFGLDPEDVAQESALRLLDDLLRRGRTFDAARGGFSAWVFLYFREAIHQYAWKRQARVRVVPPPSLANRESVAEGPLDAASRGELASTIRVAVESRLTAQERAVVQLRFWGCATLAETCAAVGLGPCRVNRILNAALRKLARAMGADPAGVRISGIADARRAMLKRRGAEAERDCGTEAVA